jgi:hypothetical protein
LVPAACWGLLWRAERNNKKTEKKKGRKRRAISCVPSFFLSLSFQAMNSREKEERKERGHTKEE